MARMTRRKPTTYKRVAISRRKKSSYARSSRVPLKFRRYVMRTLHNNAENKQRVTYGANQSLVLGSATTQTQPLLIGCLQGTDDQTRNGNSIRCVKGIWRGSFNLLPYNGTTNSASLPVWVLLYVVKDLRIQEQKSTMDGTNFGKLFRIGNSTVGFQYNPLDLSLEVNKDQFRVLYKKVFKLGVASNVFTTNTPTNATSYYDNSPASKFVTINYGKWCKKMLKFDDNNSQWSNNANLYLIMQTFPVDGTAVPVNSAHVEYHYTNTFNFEDL